MGRAIGRTNRDITEAQQITVGLTTPHAATDIFLSRELPGGYGWLFPKGPVAHVGAGVEYSRRGRLRAAIKALHARLVAEHRVGAEVLARTGGAIPTGGLLDPVAKLGATAVLLAGDAAGLANPITGAGIAAAVQSGALAGDAARLWLGGDRHALDDYRDELESVWGPALARATARRRALLDLHGKGAEVTRSAQRRGWIAYPEYWAR